MSCGFLLCSSFFGHYLWVLVKLRRRSYGYQISHRDHELLLCLFLCVFVMSSFLFVRFHDYSG